MHGSRPNLFQLRQLILAAVIITGAVAILAEVVLFRRQTASRNRPQWRSASQKWSLGRRRRAFTLREPGRAILAVGLLSAMKRPLQAAQLNSRARTEQTIVSLSQFLICPRQERRCLPKIKPVAGHVDQAGGIAVRVLDGDNYYVVRANALEDNVRFYRVVKGHRQQVDGFNTKVTSGEWHSLGLKAQADHFTIEFDGKTLFTTSDTTFAGAGKVALWTKADSVTRFDQIAINVLPQQE